jgi:hypothetical protein
MRSSIILFILTFAILGLLLGVAEVYHTGPEAQKDKMTIKENITASIKQSSNESSGNAEGSGK